MCVYLGPQNLHLKCTNSSYLSSPYNYLAVIQYGTAENNTAAGWWNSPENTHSYPKYICKFLHLYSLIAGADLSHCLSYPDASRSLTGFQAQMNTSDSWPRRTVALLGGISTSPSISIGFEWLSGRRYIRINSLQDAVRSVLKSC